MISLFEQETVIQFNRTDKAATIYTSDSTMITKLDKLCKSSPEYYKLDHEEKVDGTTVGKVYKLMDKKMLSLRGKKKEYTEEQRKVMADRMRQRMNFSE